MSRHVRTLAVAIAIAIMLAALTARAAMRNPNILVSSSPGQFETPPDSVADSTRFADPPTTLDSRARGTIGVTSLVIGDRETPIYGFYLSLNYRLSTNVPTTPTSKPHLGFGGEVGIFYLFPYLMVGPELRVDDFFFEAHGGAAFIFIVSTEAAGSAGAALAGFNAGWIIGSPETVHMELQAGADVIRLLGGPLSTRVMPHVTASFRF